LAESLFGADFRSEAAGLRADRSEADLARRDGQPKPTSRSERASVRDGLLLDLRAQVLRRASKATSSKLGHPSPSRRVFETTTAPVGSKAETRLLRSRGGAPSNGSAHNLQTSPAWPDRGTAIVAQRQERPSRRSRDEAAEPALNSSNCLSGSGACYTAGDGKLGTKSAESPDTESPEATRRSATRPPTTRPDSGRFRSDGRSGTAVESASASLRDFRSPSPGSTSRQSPSGDGSRRSSLQAPFSEASGDRRRIQRRAGVSSSQR